MTDITELAPAMKAAAEKLGGAQWQTRKGFSGIEVIVKGSLEKCSGFTSFQPVAADLADTKTARAIALFSPANILALVEALEKARAQSSKWLEAYHKAVSIGARYEERIAELEDAEQKLCAANVTLDARAELAERQLAELESRTVKLPPRAPENLACCLDGYEKWLIATTFRDTWNKCLDEVMLRGGSGIKWEAE